MVYVFTLFILILVLLAQMVVVLHAKRNLLLSPDPPLGSRAQDVFSMLGTVDAAQAAFNLAAHSALCDAHDNLTKPLERVFLGGLGITAPDILTLYEQETTRHLHKMLTKNPIPGYDYDASTSGTLPFFLHTTSEGTSLVMSSVLDISFPSFTGLPIEGEISYRPAARTPVTLHLDTLARILSFPSTVETTLRTNPLCTTTRLDALDCVFDAFTLASESLPLPAQAELFILDPSVFDSEKNAFGVFVPYSPSLRSVVLEDSVFTPVTYRLVLTIDRLPRCPNSKKLVFSVDRVARVAPQN